LFAGEFEPTLTPSTKSLRAILDEIAYQDPKATNLLIDSLAENIGVTEMPSHVNQKVNDHTVECRMPPIFGPPRNFSNSVEFKSLKRGVSVFG
jgi:hypothetical protein